MSGSSSCSVSSCGPRGRARWTACQCSSSARAGRCALAIGGGGRRTGLPRAGPGGRGRLHGRHHYHARRRALRAADRFHRPVSAVFSVSGVVVCLDETRKAFVLFCCLPMMCFFMPEAVRSCVIKGWALRARLELDDATLCIIITLVLSTV